MNLFPSLRGAIATKQSSYGAGSPRSRWSLAMTMMFLVNPAFASEAPPECRLLSTHKAAVDVNFQPGVDVRGKAVMPADLNAAPIPVPDVITVPLSIDLSRRLQNANVAGLELDAPMGLLEFHKSGRVVYDGKDLTSQVYALCGVAAPEVPDGQPPADAIKSDAVEVYPLPGEVLEGGEYREERYR